MPPLWAKAVCAHPRLARVVADVGDLVHELGKFLQLAAAILAGTQRLLQLEGDVGMTLVRLQLPVRSP